uniref:Putative DNA binding, helix-turn-helix domain containing protein n=1 Tax=viral metagenome TaxID=1070528 RepID=A0A6M3J922_9ZZZZ
MNPRRVAELLGLSYQTVSTAIESGALPSVAYESKGGAPRRLVRVRDVRDWRDLLVRRFSLVGTAAGTRKAEEIENKEV